MAAKCKCFTVIQCFLCLQYDYTPEELNRQPQMEKYTEAESRAADQEEQALRRSEERVQSRPPTQSRPAQPAVRETSQSKLFLFQFLDLVDRYWNGSKSLHKNVKFKGTVLYFFGYKTEGFPSKTVPKI